MIPRANGDENLQGVVEALDVVESLGEGLANARSLHRYVCERRARAYNTCGCFAVDVQEMHVEDRVRDVRSQSQAPDILVSKGLRAGSGRLRDRIRLTRSHDGHDLGGQVLSLTNHCVECGLGGLDVPPLLRHHHGMAYGADHRGRERCSPRYSP